MTGEYQARIAVIDEVARKHDISRRDILEPSLFKHVCAARDEAIQRIRVEFGDSIPRLAELFDRDSSSIWAALNRDRKRTRARISARRLREQRRAALYGAA